MRSRRHIPVLGGASFIAFVTCLLAPASLAQSAPMASDALNMDPAYRDCIAAIQTNPKQGRLAALRWITDGGGGPAIHCAAVGDLAMDLPRTAAKRLQDYAQTLRSTDPYLAARLYAQSAEAWSKAGRDQEAITALDGAYAMAPGALELDLIAAPVYAAAKRWGLTKRVLDRAETETALSAIALVLRARAKKELSDYRGAAEDVTKALRLSPDNIDGLILRGELVQAGYDVSL